MTSGTEDSMKDGERHNLEINGVKESFLQPMLLNESMSPSPAKGTHIRDLILIKHL